jgi:hypothetical protein
MAKQKGGPFVKAQLANSVLHLTQVSSCFDGASLVLWDNVDSFVVSLLHELEKHAAEPRIEGVVVTVRAVIQVRATESL